MLSRNIIFAWQRKFGGECGISGMCTAGVLAFRGLFDEQWKILLVLMDDKASAGFHHCPYPRSFDVDHDFVCFT